MKKLEAKKSRQLTVQLAQSRRYKTAYSTALQTGTVYETGVIRQGCRIGIKPRFVRSES